MAPGRRTVRSSSQRLLLITAALAACALGAAGMARAAPSPDGTGTLDYNGPPVGNGSTGNLLDFTFSLASGEEFQSGALRITVPGGWSAPSTNAADEGYTTSDCGIVATSGQTITVSGVTLTGPNDCDVFYGDFPGPGVTAPATPGPITFTANTKATAGGTFTPIATSPAVQILAPDGSGTITTSTQSVTPGSTGNTLTFTYTAAFGGVFGGIIALNVPSGWSDPSDDPNEPGYTTSAGGLGFPIVFGRTAYFFPIILDSGDQLDIVYGDTSGGGPGATAPATSGRYAWPTSLQASCDCGAKLKRLATYPVVRVQAPDGSGTASAKPGAVSASSHATVTLRYSPAAGGMENGEVAVDVPAGWSQPSTVPTDPGYVTSSAGAVSMAGSQIHVTGLTLFGQTLRITYGSRASGGPGALVGPSTGPQTLAFSQRSSAGGTLTPLAGTPSVNVFAPDGSGALAAQTDQVVRGSTGNVLSFTYTVAAGGVSDGAVELRVPDHWNAPSPTPTEPGYTTSSMGAVSVTGRTIRVSGITLAGGATFTITYGSTAGGGPGATAPTNTGPQIWRAAGRSTHPGHMTVLASSPVIVVRKS